MAASSSSVIFWNGADCDPKELGITELVYYPILAQLMEENPDVEDLKEAIKKMYMI